MRTSSRRGQKNKSVAHTVAEHHADNDTTFQLSAENEPVKNNTGLPDRLKTGIERLSGSSMDDVKVHFNSSKPSQLQAHAYAQGNNIHIAQGQERHLPHEAWHVVQQKQGRVKPTLQSNGVQVNDSPVLEKEADRMGQKAMQLKTIQPGFFAQKKINTPTTVAQLQSLTVSVTGLTHLVEINGSSIMEGTERTQVSSGDVLQIDNETKYRSRRGPNQELHEEADREGEHLYRWFLVTKINGEKAPKNYFIRDETFVTETPEALGKRKAKINDYQRDRVSSSELEEHSIAANIVSAAKSAPGKSNVDAAINLYLKTNKAGHSPKKTALLMRICYALSQDHDIDHLVKSGDPGDFDLVKKVVAMLSKVAGQIIQFWDNPVTDIKRRAEAWIAFNAGIDALKGDKGLLFRYINDCLVHDKGYGQTHGSATSYFLYTAEEVEDESFETVLQRALNDESNSNIWVGGMAGSGKYSTQLKRLSESEISKMETNSKEAQEKNMWTALLAPLISAKFGVGEKDWTYIATILENKDTLYATVRALVPSSFTLHKAYIDEAFEI